MIGKVQSTHNITVEEEALILNRYFGIGVIPCIIHAPYREDPTKSLSVYVGQQGNIMLRDHGLNRTFPVVPFCAFVWNKSRKEAMEIILHDLQSEFSKPALMRQHSQAVNISRKSNIIIDIYPREWKKRDVEFWKSFGISEKWCKFADIIPIEGYSIITEDFKKAYSVSQLAYAYRVFSDGMPYYKIYQPLSKTCKWRSNLTSSMMNLLNRIPLTGKRLIITSSLKDALTVWANTGVPCVCPQGEGYSLSEKTVSDLKLRYKTIVVFYDNDWYNPDNPGMTDADKICRQFGLDMMYIPDVYEQKDPSDLFRARGKEEFVRIFKEIYKNRKRYVREQENSQH